MKFAVFTVMLPDCPPERTVQLLKQYGYDGVEWRFTKTNPARKGELPSFWGNNLSTIEADAEERQLAAVKAMTEEAGLEVPNLAAYISCGDLEATERAMKAAKLLGAPSIRVGAPNYNRTRAYGEMFKEGRAFMEQVQELSRTYGVKGMIEVHHGNIACSASLARRLVEGLDPDRVGVIYDPGNMVHEGFEQYRMGLEVLGEYLGHVHVKNAAWRRTGAGMPDVPADRGGFTHEPLWQAHWEAVGQGIVHWPQVIADLKAIGYDGWLSFEDFSGSAPAEALLRDNLAYIRSLL